VPDQSWADLKRTTEKSLWNNNIIARAF
jgi:hypothetical protein